MRSSNEAAEFIGLLGGAAAAWPAIAQAQQPSKLPVIGFLGSTTPALHGHWVAAFVRGLQELGWIEGRTVVIEYRWAEGRSDRFAQIAAEFVNLKVDVIVTAGGAVLAAKQATSVIPIVFAVATDPIGGGLVASLARPGGNATGLSLQFTDTVGKRLELAREAVPGLRRLAVIGNVGYPSAIVELHEVQAIARTLGLDVSILEIRQADDIVPAVEAMKGVAYALYVAADPLATSNRIHIATAALSARLPTVNGAREYVEAGGLISYGASFSDLYRRAASYVDKILRGARAANIPVEQPTKFELVINLKTAKALGLEIPPTLLARADEVIE